MIHVFHGFLGSPEDFSFLPGEDVVLHDLYKMQSFPDITEQDVLIGYSMGGRIALEIAHAVSFRLKKLVLISAHPGIQTAQERTVRIKFENEILEKLKTLPREEFLAWWNELPIFSADRPITVTSHRYELSADLFEKHRLSKQKNFLPFLKAHPEKLLYIAGTQDKKYLELVENIIGPEGLKVKTISGGHRLFQKSTELLKILKDEGVL